jgi:hypothetical protein
MYAAITARDTRFDGQFYTAVTSTGIYCRPSCPANKPKEKNVVFYATAAGAQAAGFRACQRCIPDATPGSPLWNLQSSAAHRAMRLIEDGVVDRVYRPALEPHPQLGIWGESSGARPGASGADSSSASNADRCAHQPNRVPLGILVHPPVQ